MPSQQPQVTKHFEAPYLGTKEPTMIHHKMFAQLARKWLLIKASIRDNTACCTTSPIAEGHCAVYTANGKMFEVPLAYLGTMVFSELLWISKEFGFTHDARITQPCDAVVVDYVMCLLRRNASEEVEKAFLSTVAMPSQHSSYTMPHVALHQQFAVCSS